MAIRAHDAHAGLFRHLCCEQYLAASQRWLAPSMQPAACRHPGGAAHLSVRRLDGRDREQVPERRAVLTVVEQAHRDHLALFDSGADLGDLLHVRALALQEAAAGGAPGQVGRCVSWWLGCHHRLTVALGGHGEQPTGDKLGTCDTLLCSADQCVDVSYGDCS